MAASQSRHTMFQVLFQALFNAEADTTASQALIKAMFQGLFHAEADDAVSQAEFCGHQDLDLVASQAPC
ncbi:uncharacterized [Tachysurus ichikawai]